jgi:hypothetical protein
MTRGLGRFLRHNTIALLALFLVLGGTSFAAATLINGSQIKKHSIAKNRLTNKAIKQLKGNRGPQGAQGAQGAQGPTGAQGPAGSPDTPAQVLSKLSQNTGNFYLSEGFANWAPFSSGYPITVTRYIDTQGFSASSTGSYYLVLPLDVPASLYGNALKVVGFELCYQTNSGNEIDEIDLVKTTHTTVGQGGNSYIATDSTVRTDGACRMYTPSTTQILTSKDELSVLAVTSWTSAGAPLYMGRSTLILQATTGAITGPSHNRANMRGPAGVTSPR